MMAIQTGHLPTDTATGLTRPTGLRGHLLCVVVSLRACNIQPDAMEIGR